MYFSTLSEWLDWIGKIHPANIELGLDRVKAVATKLNLLHPKATVITVAGTNGKGSTVAGIEAIYLAAGFNVGAFTTPFLFRYNEQVRVNGESPPDAAFIQAFEQIESAREEVTLTPFEYAALSALIIFKQHDLHVLLLEVGLGGRLDAVNIIDPDIAIVTNISIDHTEWLGETREKIAVEKAGIFRSGKPAIIGEYHPPQSLIDEAKAKGAQLYQQGEQFHYENLCTHWAFISSLWQDTNLPQPKLAIQNMATALMAIALLQPTLPVAKEAVVLGLTHANLPGRLQKIPGAVLEIYDVSHNPASVGWLKEHLDSLSCEGNTYAVFSMLADKDIAASLHAIKPYIHEWYVAPLEAKRAASEEVLKKVFKETHIAKVNFFETIQLAYQAAKSIATPKDRIVIFGSFHTVADVLATHAKEK